MLHLPSRALATTNTLHMNIIAFAFLSAPPAPHFSYLASKSLCFLELESRDEKVIVSSPLFPEQLCFEQL